MLRFLITTILLAASACSHAVMATNPDVRQDTIAQTICVSGWTKTVRPPVSFTQRVKRGLLAAIGLPWERNSDFELDHRIALTIGGHPSSADNLWLQAWSESLEGWDGPTSARAKDKLEVRLNRLVCAGEITLHEAQSCMYDDWQACAEKHPPKRKAAK